MNAIDIVKYLEQFYPKTNAYDWDNVGVQVGSLNKKTKKVMITLDLTKEVVKEAIEKKINLIICHHPLLFKPVSSLHTETPRGWIISKLIKHDIALYAMHTNYDVSNEGMNDEFASILGIQNPQLLDDEVGIGRYGEIENEMPMLDWIAFIKKQLGLKEVKLIGSVEKIVKKVGISGGSGSIHINAAKRKNCDVYLTGDVTYHTALDAIQMGLNVIDIGHHAEKIFCQAIKRKLDGAFPDIEIMISETNTNPYQVY